MSRNFKPIKQQGCPKKFTLALEEGPGVTLKKKKEGRKEGRKQGRKEGRKEHILFFF